MCFAPLLDTRQVSRIGFRRSPSDWVRLAASYLERLAVALGSGKFDAVWIEKELLPFVPGIAETLLIRRKRPFVVDFDDAIFHNYDRSGSALVRATLAGKFDRLLPASAAVTAGSAYLAEFANKAGAQNVVQVPSTIDLDQYPLVRYPPAGSLRIAWVGGRTTTQHLTALLPTLAEASRSIPLELVAIGANPLAWPGLRIEQHDWSHDTEASILSTCHVGVMPLPDNPWERGKCAYKLIQYMACARPVIASPVGANRDVVVPDTGRLAGTSEEWIEALSDCAANPLAWEQMGRSARARVETLYSKQTVGPQIVGLFNSLVEA